MANAPGCRRAIARASSAVAATSMVARPAKVGRTIAQAGTMKCSIRSYGAAGWSTRRSALISGRVISGRDGGRAAPGRVRIIPGARLAREAFGGLKSCADQLSFARVPSHPARGLHFFSDMADHPAFRVGFGKTMRAAIHSRPSVTGM